MNHLRVSPVLDVDDALNALEILCKGYRAVAFLICECGHELQDQDREGVSIVLDQLTDTAESLICDSWKVLRVTT